MMPKIRHNLRKTNKYNAKPTEVEGYRFDSKAEANYFKLLRIQEKEGTVLEILRQVPIHLVPGVTWRLDFFVFFANGECMAIEVKGFETPDWKIKKQLVKEHKPNIYKILKVVK